MLVSVAAGDEAAQPPCDAHPLFPPVGGRCLAVRVTGYDPEFLPVDVPLPAPVDPRPLRDLGYQHFTVLLDPVRRLAAATAVNIDGDLLVDVGRGDDWHLDDRVPESEQCGNELYRSNDLDRGHLVRRRDPVWGARELAERANGDSFAYTNAAPQAAGFNQSGELWLGLEDHVLAYAEQHRHRVSVFTGPVLAEGDPEYRGVLIPQEFWKVAVWSTASGIAAAGFLLDQRPALEPILTALPVPPPLEPFRTFQVPVSDVAAAAGLDFGPLAEVDVLALRGVRPGQPPRRLRSVEDLELG